MAMIFLLGSIALLWLHLAGVTLLFGRVLPYPLARVVGVLGITLVVCAFEHFCGLGNINWLWPFTAAIAAAIVWWERPRWNSSPFWRGEVVLGVAFAYGLIWKFLFPTIYPTSERVTDLYFMQNYYPGDTLPPLDIWYPPHRFDFYYAFEHYGAALMGRLLGWNAGFAYNIAFVLVMALSATLAWDFASRLIKTRLPRVVLVAAVMIGGTGISPLIHLVVNDQPNNPPEWNANDHMWASARFIGSYDTRIAAFGTELGRSVFPPLTDQSKPTPDFEARDLPMENFGYQYFLGDYHPPLGSFLLLFLPLALLAWLEVAPAACRHPRLAQALLPATLPLMLITNTWIFPFALVLQAAWTGWRYLQKRPPDWAALVAGGLISAVLVYPYLSGLANQAINTPIHLVKWMDHTPLLRYVALMWPLLLLLVLALFERRTRPFALMLVLAFGAMLILSEFIYVQDPSGGKFTRTNTTMKWWGWMWSGALLALGGIALASARRWIRGVALAALLLITVCYGYDTAYYWWATPKGDMGRMNGASGFTADAPMRDMVNFLSVAPRGILLENVTGDAYTNQTLLALFSGQIEMQGWPNHVSLWHAAPADVWMQSDRTKLFYKGALPDALDWLSVNHVRYVAWTRVDSAAGLAAWQNINTAISSQYSWHPFFADTNSQVGLWIRR
ncbi:DUF2298 domain-containing protein [Amantichitinum ursilacus]|uniref:Uncharacterized protein n=1 Tax=Amantichitinum ursilacus TaxID=857265 RepID=A0A0N0XHU2_9NEIS|nr:DUF2298 domain-containing protein [Amantichitinum ursilacus]KPC49383.1 hypothetical protein WG78_20850 [Amantichitinum ursilacus]